MDVEILQFFQDSPKDLNQNQISFLFAVEHFYNSLTKSSFTFLFSWVENNPRDVFRQNRRL